MAWKIPNKIIFKASLFHAASLKVSMAGPEQVNHYNITFVFVSESTSTKIYVVTVNEVMQPQQSAIVATFTRKIAIVPPPQTYNHNQES